MLDILEWIVEIVALDLRRVSAVGLSFYILLYGGLSLVLIIAPGARFVQGPSWGTASVWLLALALGLPMLGRIVWGLYYRWRGPETDAAKETGR